MDQHLRNSKQNLSKSWQKTSDTSKLEKNHWRSQISNSSFASRQNECVVSLIESIKQKAVSRTDTGLSHITHKHKLNNQLYEFLNKISDEDIDLDLKIALYDEVNQLVTNKDDHIDNMRIQDQVQCEELRIGQIKKHRTLLSDNLIVISPSSPIESEEGHFKSEMLHFKLFD